MVSTFALGAEDFADDVAISAIVFPFWDCWLNENTHKHEAIRSSTILRRKKNRQQQCFLATSFASAHFRAKPSRRILDPRMSGDRPAMGGIDDCQVRASEAAPSCRTPVIRNGIDRARGLSRSPGRGRCPGAYHPDRNQADRARLRGQE